MPDKRDWTTKTAASIFARNPGWSACRVFRGLAGLATAGQLVNFHNIQQNRVAKPPESQGNLYVITY